MIYFVRAGAHGPVKIGKTNDVATRVAELATAHYETLSVLATLDVANRVETLLHRLLKEHRLKGEWFAWCPEVAAVVELAKAGKLPDFPYDHHREERERGLTEQARGAAHLAAYLKRRGVTVVEAAKQTGIDRSILQRIKTGSRPASKDAIRKLVAWSNGELDFATFFEDEAA